MAVLAVVSTVASQSLIVNLSGVVKNKTGAALNDAIVTLEKRDVSVLTNGSGEYSIQVLPVTQAFTGPTIINFEIKNGSLIFTVREQGPVAIDIFDLNGRRVATPVNEILPKGKHAVRFPVAGVIGNMYLVRSRIGSTVTIWKYMTIDNSIRRITTPSTSAASSVASLMASVDTIRASKAGYRSARIPVSSLNGTLDITLDSLENGSGTVGTSPIDNGAADRIKHYGVDQYFWGDLGNGNVPLVKITNAVSTDVVDLEVTFNPDFVDNTYGTGSQGWSQRRGHTFRDLHISDHVEIAVVNGAGDTVWHGRLDLLSASNDVSSGYACLGPFGGDGAIFIGNASDVISFGSSLDDNINYYGYELLVNSPATDSTFKQNPEYPYWQYYVSYHLTLDKDIFGPSGYGEVHMTSVHASPSKNGPETVEVTELPPPVPGSPEDPFRFMIPNNPTTPPDTTTNPPPDDTTGTDTTTPPNDTTPTDPGIGVD